MLFNIIVEKVINIINLAFCATIFYFGISYYKKTKDNITLLIAISFGLFGLLPLAPIMYEFFNSQYILLLVKGKIIAFTLIIIFLYKKFLSVITYEQEQKVKILFLIIGTITVAISLSYFLLSFIMILTSFIDQSFISYESKKIVYIITLDSAILNLFYGINISFLGNLIYRIKRQDIYFYLTIAILLFCISTFSSNIIQLFSDTFFHYHYKSNIINTNFVLTINIVRRMITLSIKILGYIMALYAISKSQKKETF